MADNSSDPPQQPLQCQPEIQQPNTIQGNLKGDVPPPYYAPNQLQQEPYPAPMSQFSQPVQQPSQSSCNVVVVQAQSTPAPQVVQVVQRKPGDYFLTLSITLTFICFGCGTWYSLLCTIPAIFFAISARDSDVRGDMDKAKIKGRIALILNIVSIISWVIILVIIIGSVAGVVSNASSDNSYSYYYSYYRYYYYYYYRK